MKFIEISIEDYSNLRSELNEFIKLANQHNHKPSKDEFDDIIKFILLYQSGTTTLCESYNENKESFKKILNHLYESYINEAGDSSWKDERDFDSAVGTVKTAGIIAGGAIGSGAVGLGFLISYIFKRGKLKKMIEDEFKPDFDRLKTYEKINSLKAELHKLKGEKGEPKNEIPGLTKVDDSKKQKINKK